MPRQNEEVRLRHRNKPNDGNEPRTNGEKKWQQIVSK